MKSTNDIYKIDEHGNREYVGCYEGSFSAEYALYLYWCQYISRCDYMNLANRRKYTAKRVIGKTMRNVLIDVGEDVYCCAATKENGYNVITGKSCSKFDYEPNYPV